MKRLPLSLILLCLALLTETVAAREFRSIRPIAKASVGGFTEQSQADTKLQPVSAEILQQAVAKIAESYNTPAMQQLLAADFFDADSLIDSIENVIPRDAVVRVLSLQNSRTIAQREEIDATGTLTRVSRVEITINTQLEFNDPSTGFQRLPGTTRYVLDINEAVEGVE